MNTIKVAIINIIALAAVLSVNALANILPINGYNTGQVSDFYPSLFTPAGFTFSVWSVIYLFLLVFAFAQFSYRSKPYFVELSLWFWVSCVANASWILAWHYLFIWASVVIMLILLFSLVKIFLLLVRTRSLTFAEQGCVKLPFVFYLSWICVATIANVSALLVSLQWEGGWLAPEVWTIVMTAVATLLGVIIAGREQTPSFLLVLMWALWGIYSKQTQGSYSEIATVAMTEIILLIFVFGYLVFRYGTWIKTDR